MSDRPLLGWAESLARYSLDQYWRQVPPLPRLRGHEPQLIAFDDAFPGVEKYDRVPASSIATPGVTNVLLEPDAQHLASPSYTVPEDFVAAIDGGLLAGGNSVVLSDARSPAGARHVVDESSTARQMRFFLKREFYLRPELLSGVAAPLRSRFHNFYHWMVDCLPRLVTLAQSPWAGDGPITLLYTDSLAPYEQFFLDRFAPGTFQLRRVQRHTLYRVDTLLFTPLKTQRFAGYLPARYADAIRQMVVPDRPRRRDRRVIVSRAAAQYRHVGNEEALAEALAPLGFDTVRLETLSIPEQVQLFYDAEVVVSPHGAGLTNLLYAEAAHVLELFPSPTVTPHYFFLCKSLGHTYACHTGTADRLNPPTFEADVDAARAVIDRWLHRIHA